jgi:hypothetical protein
VQPPPGRVQRRRRVGLRLRAHQEMVGKEGRVEPRKLRGARRRGSGRGCGEGVEGGGGGGGAVAAGGFARAGELAQRRGAPLDEEVGIREQSRKRSRGGRGLEGAPGGREGGARGGAREEAEALRAEAGVGRRKRRNLSRGGVGPRCDSGGGLKSAVVVRWPVSFVSSVRVRKNGKSSGERKSE